MARQKLNATQLTSPKSTGSKSTGSKSTGSKSTSSKSTGFKSTGFKSTGSKSTGSKPVAKLAVRPPRLRAKIFNLQSKAAKRSTVLDPVDNVVSFSSAKRQAVELGESVVTWGKAHPLQTALVAAAMVAGVAVLVSFARSRRALAKPTSEATARSPMHFNVKDLVTSHVTTPHIPSYGHGRPFTRAITPTLEQTIASNHSGQPHMP